MNQFVVLGLAVLVVELFEEGEELVIVEDYSHDGRIVDLSTAQLSGLFVSFVLVDVQTVRVGGDLLKDLEDSGHGRASRQVLEHAGLKVEDGQLDDEAHVLPFEIEHHPSELKV